MKIIINASLPSGSQFQLWAEDYPTAEDFDFIEEHIRIARRAADRKASEGAEG